jgi:hypothetical protein
VGRLLAYALVCSVGCYHPNAAQNVPCSSTLQCPTGQQCDTTQSPPVCIVGTPPDAKVWMDAPIDSPPPGTFPTDTLVIPMDDRFQDAGQLRAFGLVDALLRGGVTLSWIIQPGKAAGSADLLLSSVLDERTGSAVASPTSYAGGPFLVDPGELSTAQPIVDAWLGSNASLVVHRYTGPAFMAPIGRHLEHAPSIAVLADLGEPVAFDYLDAAGIPDALGSAWGSGSPGALTEAQVAAGALADPVQGYCTFISVHDVADAATPQVATAMRSWLAAPNHAAIVACLAVSTLENAGNFLTTKGIVGTTGTAAQPVSPSDTDDPHAQFVGAFAPVGGALGFWALGSGSKYAAGVHALLASSVLNETVMVYGSLDGNPAEGELSYLAGHSYTTTLPMSLHPQTIGARVFLDAIFASPCVGAP